ncbi:hypothetical protein [Halorientalis salina]|uniref:hypothetical protein n=1 Tax=Halorientalis salina TaxID=2932266 RepID=UPI0010AD844D|nr:hypothetical protein [Halorientalis salina]
MRTVVADTSALVSLAIPKADGAYDTDSNPDPLQYLLTSCAVSIPTQVRAELQNIAQYSDIDGAAAANVLAASDHYTVEDPLQRSETPPALPEWGLDGGETAALVLANALGVDAFLTDEFAGSSFALIHARLADATVVTTPRLLRDYAYTGHLSESDARTILDVIGRHRSWKHNSYVQHVKGML